MTYTLAIESEERRVLLTALAADAMRRNKAMVRDDPVWKLFDKIADLAETVLAGSGVDGGGPVPSN